MEIKTIQSRSSRPRKSQNLVVHADSTKETLEKIIISKDEGRIEVEIRHIVRVHARDFEAIKNSFEEWARQWE